MINAKQKQRFSRGDAGSAEGGAVFIPNPAELTTEFTESTETEEGDKKADGG